jgi:CheY-like chemotaxis protein
VAVERRPVDFTLPAMNGYEVAARLRAGRAHLPILLITVDGQAPRKLRRSDRTHSSASLSGLRSSSTRSV